MAGYMIWLRADIDDALREYMRGTKLSVGLGVNEVLKKHLKQEGFYNDGKTHN